MKEEEELVTQKGKYEVCYISEVCWSLCHWRMKCGRRREAEIAPTCAGGHLIVLSPGGSTFSVSDTAALSVCLTSQHKKALQRAFRLFWLGAELDINLLSSRSWLELWLFSGVPHCYFYHLWFSWVFSQTLSEGLVFAACWILDAALCSSAKENRALSCRFAGVCMFLKGRVIGDESQELTWCVRVVSAE